MTHFVFTSEADANTAKAEMDAAYGCPYSDSVYDMTEWATVFKHPTDSEWALATPKDSARMGVLAADVIAAVTPSYAEETLTSDWYPTEE